VGNEVFFYIFSYVVYGNSLSTRSNLHNLHELYHYVGRAGLYIGCVGLHVRHKSVNGAINIRGLN
jgi:hypothetical protein